MRRATKKHSPKNTKKSGSLNRCFKELQRVKAARSSKSKNAASTAYQKCLVNSSDGKIKTGYKFTKKERKKLKEGKKI